MYAKNKEENVAPSLWNLPVNRILAIITLFAMTLAMTAATPVARVQALPEAEPASSPHAVYLPLVVRPEKWPPMNRAFELRFIELLNAERARNGLGPVSEEPCLVAAARRHAKDMAVNGFVGHKGTDGTRPGERAMQEGCLAGQWMGEAAAGVDITPEQSVADFLNSPPHRAILLMPVARIGVGVYPSGPGYAVVINMGNPPPPPPPEATAAILARLQAHRAANGAAPLARDAALDRVAQRAFAWLDESNRSSGYSNICTSPQFISYGRMLDWAAQEGYGGDIDYAAHVACLFDANGKTAEQVADAVWAWAAQRPNWFNLPRLAQAQWDDIGIVVAPGYSYMVVIIVGDRP